MSNPLRTVLALAVCHLEKMIDYASSVQDEGPEGEGWRSGELQADLKQAEDFVGRLKQIIKEKEIV